MAVQGAVLADSPTAATFGSESTIVCVSNHEAFVSVIHNGAVATSLEGKRLIQLGVVTAELARNGADPRCTTS